MNNTSIQTTYTVLATELVTVAQKAEQLRAVQADLNDLLAEYQPIVASRLNDILQEEILTLGLIADSFNDQMQLKLSESVEDKLGLGQVSQVLVA